MEVNQFNLSVEILDQRCATFDPIAGIQINNAADGLYLCAMDVTANDAVHVVFARRLHDRGFVVAHIFYRGFGFVFQVGRDRPIPETESAPDAVEMEIEIQNPIVEPGANAVEQPIAMRDAIELMAVQNEVAFAACGGVNDLARERHAAEIHVEKLLDEFIVIAGDVDDLRLLAAFAKQFLDQHIVAVFPMPFGFQLPAVNEIADQIKIPAIRLAQEMQHFVHLRVPGA